MSRNPLLAWLALALPLFALDSRHTYLTPDELQGFGDVNGDSLLDVLLVDRASGQLRIGLAGAGGTIVWQNPKPTGVPDAESIASGRITGTTADQLAITGRAANHVHVLDPAATVVRPTVLKPNGGIGPSTVAAIDLAAAGNDPALLDLAVVTVWNNPGNTPVGHRLQSTAGGFNTLADLPLATLRDRASRVRMRPSDPDRLALIERGGTDTILVYNNSNPALPLLTSLAGLPANSDFVHARFFGAGRNQFVFFVRGSAGFQVADVVPASGAFAAAAVNHLPDPSPVRSLHLVDDGTKVCLAVVFGNGERGAIYQFNNAGVPSLVETLLPPTGDTLNGVSCPAPGAFHLLVAPPGGGASRSSIPYHHDGSAWVRGTPTDMPGTGSARALANVFLYDGEPLVDDDAKLLETIQVPDWTSGFSIDSSLNVTVTAEAFAGNSAGLDNPATVAVGTAPSGTSHGLANQYAGTVSVSSPQSSVGPLPVQISIDPPAGTYSRYFTARLVSPDTALNAFYRFGSTGTWTPFNLASDTIVPPAATLAPFSIQYYAEDPATGRRSPIYQASYSFTGDPGSLDSDGDGVPDFVELAKGLNPLAGPDSDSDGLSDIEELLYGSNPANGSETRSYTDSTTGMPTAIPLPPSRTNDSDGDGHSDFAEWIGGSNPLDPASAPAADALADFQNTVDFAVRPLSHSGSAGTLPNRPSFPDSHPSYAGTPVQLHGPDGRLLASSVTENGSHSSLSNPFAAFDAVRANGRDLFVIGSTSPSFDIAPAGTGLGRELAFLLPVPTLDAGAISYTYSNSPPATEATAWINALQAHYAALSRPSSSAEVSLFDSLSFLLFERVCGHFLKLRNPALPAVPVSLTEFRDTRKPKTSDDPSRTDEPLLLHLHDLLPLQQYLSPTDTGWLLQTLFQQIDSLVKTSADARMTALRKLANQLHQISVANSSTDPALYPSPFDTLRDVVNHLPASAASVDGVIPLPGDPPSGSPDPAVSYSAAVSLSPVEKTAADACLAWLLGELDARTVVTHTARVTASSFDGTAPELTDTTSLATLRLYDADGNPFRFPEAFNLPVGTTVSVTAFNDRTNLPSGSGTALEVIDATISEFPSPPSADLNRNAIDDSYETYFFGGSVDPFDDDDGDGYPNVQEFLDGTNAASASSHPAGAALRSQAPPIRVSLLPSGNLRLELAFPSRYADRIEFILQTAGDLTIPFAEVPSSTAADAGMDLYALEIPKPVSPRHFFRFRMALR